ncbi:MAG: FtsX-like permease family protein [Chloroflexi bacterium]|nr:FtsX-like permease family protein [Chloroflexota bacterium]
MLIVARKNLFSERVRLAISVGGIALSVLLITFLLALFRGWNEKVGGFVEEVDADIWIAREGTTDFLVAASILPLEGADERFARIDSIERWSPLIAVPMGATKGDTKMDIQLIGFDPATGMGGPVRVTDGKSVPGPGEMIIDQALTSRYGVEIGDSLNAAGTDWEVVGKSTGGDFVASQAVFVTIEQAQAALVMEGLATFLLVDLVEMRDPATYARTIAGNQPGVVGITSEEFAAATRDRVLGDVIPILTVILILAFIVGLAVAGLTIYTATVEKAREYGILKAVGFPNSYLYRVVFEQSIVTGLLGFGIGTGITVVAGSFIQDLVPQFVTLIRWQDVLAVAGVTLVMSVLAAYVPIRRLAAIDPVAVFKA